MGSVHSIFRILAKSSSVSERYLVVRGKAKATWFFLSPSVMQINEDTFIIDINPTKTYWQHLCQKRGVSFMELIEPIVKKSLHDDFVACLSDRPFRGLLLTNFLWFRSIRGLHTMQSKFLQSFLAGFQLQFWFFTARQIEVVCDQHKLYEKERATFYNNLGRFERFLEKMGYASSKPLQDIRPSDIRRRFGALLGRLWSWTLPGRDTQSADKTSRYAKEMNGFPWVSYQSDDHPSVKTSLEHPLSTWMQMEPIIEEDLQKISAHQLLKPPAKVSEMKWTLIAYDGDHLCSSMHFTYPICLHDQSKKNFKGMLKQFHHAFESIQLEHQNHEIECEAQSVLLGWNIEVVQWVHIKKMDQNLFDLCADLSIDKVKDLQINIKPDIETYSLLENPVPTLDAARDRLGDKSGASTQANQRIAMKPLYIYPSPVEISDQKIVYRHFLERTASDWWNQKDPHNHYRDYYICETDDGQFVWAFQDTHRKWYKHGSY